MEFLLAQFLSALKLGSIYALIAIGYSIVYSIMGLINFAHGELMMIAVYTLWVLTEHKVPFAIAFFPAILLTIAVGVAMERIAYRPLKDRGEETLIITSLAVSVFLQSLCQSIFGPSNQALILPDVFSVKLVEGRVNITVMNLLIFVLTIVLIIAVALILKKTKFGIAMRSCSDNGEAAELMGVDRNAVIRLAFMIGSALAAVAGIMYAGEYISFSPTMGFMLGVKAFIAAVIGGLGSFEGAAAGGFILGFLEIFLAGYLPDSLTSYQTAFVFMILIIILLVRPNGLLGSSVQRS